MAVRKTKIEGGSAWRWYTEPDADSEYLALATLIELRSVRDLPRFEWYTIRVHRQLARTAGLVGYSFRGQFPSRYWTLSAWQSGRHLQGFVKAGTHLRVMAGLRDSMRDFRHVHWRVRGAELPLAWSAGLHRLTTRTGAAGTAGGPTPARPEAGPR